MSMVRTVVLADPHSVLRIGLRQLLESTSNYQVVASVDDRVSAVQAAADEQPDILVVDLSCTDACGAEFVEELKRAAPRARVVIYTFISSERAWLGAVEAGADAIVFKSDPEDQLLRAVSAVSVGRQFFSCNIPEAFAAKPGVRKLISPREQEIVRLIASGMSNLGIGHFLGISHKTVEKHRAKASEKLSCRTTADLVRYALRNDLIAA